MGEKLDIGPAHGSSIKQDSAPAYEHKSDLSSSSSSDEDVDDAPTEEELRTLHRVRDHIPLKVYTVAFIELCERFSYYGTTVVCTYPSLPQLMFVAI